MFLLVIFFLCWGSFLNVVAYRLIKEESIIFPRSHCPCCKHQIVWYDNIPVLSWLLLTGKCRQCRKPISYLYPAIECFTALAMSALFLSVPLTYFPLYFIFFSALIVTIRSDVETMLISRFVSVYLIPIGVIGSMMGYLPITMRESMLGCMIGYAILYFTAIIFAKYRRQEGIGQGDLDLLAFIGAFVGPLGCWFTLLIGSLAGSCIGILYLLICKPENRRLPFGPFLALGAMVYALFHTALLVI